MQSKHNCQNVHPYLYLYELSKGGGGESLFITSL